jgi:ABC-type dipeptide/oligopeptide/nickel transport system ATPase subunit
VVNLYGLSIQRNGESVFNIDSKGCEVNFDSELIQGFFSKNEGKRNIFEDYGEKEGAHSLEVRLGDVGLDIVQKRSEIDGISSSSFRSMSDQYFVSGFLDDLLIKIAKVFQHRKISWIGANRNVTSQKLIINSESGFIADSYLNKQAITELNKWLKTTNIINLGYQFILNEVKSIEGIETDDLTLTEFGVKKDDKLYALNEVGSGISHVFQILISVFNKPELLIIQQPELHLHPSLQVQLINSIISLSKQFGIQVVIETHSEHVIKAAQLEISKGVSSDKSLLTAEELNVLYISKNKEGFSSVKKIEVDKTGSFTEPWPDDFFELSADLGLERLRQGYKSKN